MATALAEAGSDIVICSRRKDHCERAAAELRALGTQVLAVECDVSKADQIESLKDRVCERFGRVDVLVNNAGRTWWAAPEDLPLERWQYVIDLNVTGTFLCSQIFGRVMIKQRRGKIINIASASGLVGKNPAVHNSIAYNATKGAVVNLTRDLAVKWAQHNILVNAIAPGATDTPMSRAGSTEEEWKKREAVPPLMGGLTRKDEIVGLIRYLLSEPARYLTGQTFLLRTPT